MELNFSDKMKSIKWRVLILIFGVFFVLSVLIVILTIKSSNAQLNDDMRRKMKTIAKSFQNNVKEKVFSLEMAQNFIVDDAETKKLFYERDRDGLIEKYQDMFDTVLKRQYKVNIFQFHLPPATSFYRVHKLGKFGDDLSKFRHTVVSANREKTLQAGIEVGKFGASLRVVRPMTYQGEHIGTVEIGSDFIDLLNTSASAMNVEYAVGVDKDVLNAAGFKLDVDTEQIENFVFYAFSEQSFKSILNGKQLSDDVQFVEYNDKNMVCSSVDMEDYSGTKIGKIVIGQDITEEKSELFWNLFKTIGALSFAVIIFSMGIYALLSRKIFNPLNSTIDHLDSVAKGDLAEEFNYHSDDEIGNLMDTIGEMTKSLRKMVIRITGQSEELLVSADEFSSATEVVNSNATGLAERSSTVSSAVEELNANMATIAAAAEESRTNIENVTSTTAEMSAVVSEISRNTSQAQDIASRAVTTAENASTKINLLGDAAQDISRVIEVINDIADQTKLLALNATIEASRAGEAGKGFAVVANEVKELARQTNEATTGITEKITNMQTSAKDSVTEISNISGVIGEINEIVTGIASAIEEQAVTTKDITGNIEYASQGVGDVTTNVTQAADATRLISEEVVSVSSSSNELKEGVDKINHGVQDVLNMSRELKEIVENFKL